MDTTGRLSAHKRPIINNLVALNTIPYNSLKTIYLLLLSGCTLLLPATGSAQHRGNAFPSTPPAPYAVAVGQPDGTTLHLVGRGTPAQHWSETTDGYTVVKTKSGHYEYAEVEDNQLVASGIQAIDPPQRLLADQRKLVATPKHLQPSPEKVLTQQIGSPLRSARAETNLGMPSRGNVRVLAILIDYSDLPATHVSDDFGTLFNGPSDQPTFQQYFLENSYGELSITVDVLGWVRAKHGYQRYSYGKGRSFLGAQDLVGEAVDQAEEAGVDFSIYDNNNDNYVDGVFVIHSGPGAEEGGLDEYVWSHRWEIYRNYDQRHITSYAIQPEIRQGPEGVEERMAGIGIFCHEFGHLLGLPDLYDTHEKSQGIGHWGLMGRGGWLGNEAYPAGLTAWSKERLGWADVTDITGSYGAYTLGAASLDNTFYKIRTSSPDEYFLLENRQRRGVDVQLPGTGLALWHIDNATVSLRLEANEINANFTQKGVDLEEADGANDLDRNINRGDGGDLFPGKLNKISFNTGSNPSSDQYEVNSDSGSTGTGVSIEEITERETQIRFIYHNDSLALVAIHRQMGGEQWSGMAHWLTHPMADWEGVRVVNGRVTELRLDQVGLINQFPSELHSLTALKTLVVRESLLSGTLGKKILGLTQLEDLVIDVSGLGVNFLSDVGQLASLKKLVLISVSVDQAFPASISQLTNLEELTISNAKMSGQLPGELAQLKALTRIDLSYNQLSGPVPKSWAQMTLDKLVLNNNQLSGEFPAMTMPRQLDISTNQFTVLPELPSSGDQPGQLVCHSNQFTFEDLIPNQAYLTCTDCQDRYVPQQEVNLDIRHTVAYPENETVMLPFDEKVVGSQYVWYQQDREVIQTEANRLPIATSTAAEAGSYPYECTITNPVLPGLTLRVTGITVIVPEKQSAAIQAVIEVKEIDDKTFGDKPFMIKARTSAQVPLVYLRIEGAITLKDSLVTIIGAGTVIIRITSPQNDQYAAVDTLIAFDVAKASQTIMLSPLPDTVMVSDKLVVDARASSGLPLRVIIQQGAAVLSNNTLSFQEPGSVTLQIVQSGDNNYQAAPALTSVLTVVSPTPTIQTLAQHLVYDASELQFGDSLQIEASSGKPLRLRVLTGSAQVVKEGWIKIIGVGSVRVEAKQDSVGSYAAIDTVIAFSVMQASQTIVFESTPLTYRAFLLQAQADSGLPVAYQVQSGRATISRDTLFVHQDTSVVVVATQWGNENYQAADPQRKRFDLPLITSTKEEASMEVTRISPNPSSAVFQIDLADTISQADFRVIDTQGQPLMEGHLRLPGANIDLSRYANGTYILYLQTKHQVSQHRLVKL